MPSMLAWPWERISSPVTGKQVRAFGGCGLFGACVERCQWVALTSTGAFHGALKTWDAHSWDA